MLENLHTRIDRDIKPVEEITTNNIYTNFDKDFDKLLNKYQGQLRDLKIKENKYKVGDNVKTVNGYCKIFEVNVIFEYGVLKHHIEYRAVYLTQDGTPSNLECKFRDKHIHKTI